MNDITNYIPHAILVCGLMGLVTIGLAVKALRRFLRWIGCLFGGPLP